MKLHLPKTLVAAVLCSMPSIAAEMVETGETESKKYDIGNYQVEKIASKYTTDPVLLSDDTHIVTYDDIKLTGDDQLGAFNKGTLITSFGKYTLEGVTIPSWIPIVGGLSGHKITKEDTVSNNLKINGTLTIENNAQVALGGQVATNLYAEYAGIIAKNVIVDGYNEGEEGYKGVTNLNSWSAYVNSLVVNGGSVKLHADTPQGNTCIVLKESSAVSPSDSKQVQITEALTITDGSVTIGHNSVADQTNTDSHVVTTFGSYSYEGTPVVVDNKVYGITNPKINSSQITQEGGTLNIYGKSASIGGLNIKQTGGKMSVSEAINGYSGYHFISDYGQSSIEQNGDSDTILSIGVIKAYNTYFDSIVASLKENEGAAYDYKKPSVSITQGGSGTINLNGVDFTEKIVESEAVSSITQTGNGTINLNGQYKGAKFDIKQQGTTVGDKTATINVAKGAEITVNSMTLEGGVFINNGTVNGPMASQVATLAEEGDISTTTDAEATFITIAGGEYKNFGTTNADILVDGGTLTLENGSSVGNIEMKSGSILVTNDEQTATVGSITLSGGSITFEADAQLTLQTGAVVELGEGVEVIVQMSADALAALEAGSNVTLFDAGTNTVEFNNTLITFKDDQNNEVKATVTGNTTGGNVTVNAVVPEPTTATLSLLALAALASRRRRK